MQCIQSTILIVFIGEVRVIINFTSSIIKRITKNSRDNRRNKIPSGWD